jgi:hypothetical protein
VTRQQLVIRWFWSTLAIVTSLVWLHHLGVGDLASPPMSIDGITTWLEHTDTMVAAFAILRVIALCFGWYLLVVISLGSASRYFALPRMTSLFDRLTLPFARGMLGGIALLGVMSTPPSPPHAPDAMVELPAEPNDDRVTLHLVDEAPAPSPAPAPTPSPVVDTPPTDDHVWVVEPGESLWSIAASHLAEARGRSVSEQEIAPYWRQVVELNRARLVNPSDADLLFTGQTVELPAVG